MKKNTSFNHFTGKEQQALSILKKRIVELYQPLVIYLIRCNSSNYLRRNCFDNPRQNNQWYFSCDLLLVLPNGDSLPENAAEELKNISNDYEHIHLIAHPFDFVAQQLQEYSLFFCWIQRRAIALYERDGSIEKLPEPVQNMKQYEQQVHDFFIEKPNYENYLSIKLSPIPQKLSNQEEDKHVKQPTLSEALLNRMTNFILERGAKNMKVHMQEAMTAYIIHAAKKGISANCHAILWDFEELIAFFNLAEKELNEA